MGPSEVTTAGCVATAAGRGAAVGCGAAADDAGGKIVEVQGRGADEGLDCGGVASADGDARGRIVEEVRQDANEGVQSSRMEAAAGSLISPEAGRQKGWARLLVEP